MAPPKAGSGRPISTSTLVSRWPGLTAKKQSCTGIGLPKSPSLPESLTSCRSSYPNFRGDQATFLVLVRKARAIRKRESVGSWLFKVAHRVALAARERAAGRAAHERPLIELPAAPIADHMETRELMSLLDEAVHRLPDKYRVPIVLCHFE